MFRVVGCLIGAAACITMAYSMLFWEYATWGDERYVEIPLFVVGAIILMIYAVKPRWT